MEDEPHVQELCAFLNEMGGKVTGAGTSSLTVTGVDGLGGAKFTLSDDFHEVATFLALGAITGGEISVRNDRPDHFPLIDRAFGEQRAVAMCAAVDVVLAVDRCGQETALHLVELSVGDAIALAVALIMRDTKAHSLILED